jgi:hypothetical protein
MDSGTSPVEEYKLKISDQQYNRPLFKLPFFPLFKNSKNIIIF